ncbi:MAG: serine/threonine protein kinase, partial [Myxococcales bacterium]|nr:serine/threonine protein kinase [Myxococcales bacterium]
MTSDTTPRAAAPREHPRILDRYRVTGRIASGSVGSVLSAVDERSGAPVAIKCFDGGHDNYAAWLDEMRLIMRLRHRNIVAVLDVGHDDSWGLDVLVFARALGGSLRRALVSTPRFDRERTRALLRDVAAALAHAHAHGVIHRDIKPENILALKPEGGPPWAVTDFGAGRFLSSGLERGSFAGSPGYYAPELLHGHLGPALDQYSLGVVGVELLTGERPDHDDCLAFALAHHDRSGLEGLLARMVSIDPERRLPNLESVHRALAGAREPRVDVTRDDQGRRFSLEGNELRWFSGDTATTAGRLLIPRARRFCSLRGHPMLVAGERRLVSFIDKPRTEYAA